MYLSSITRVSLIFWLLACCMAAGPMHAQTTFEGSMTLTMPFLDQVGAGPVTYYIKGRQVRYEYTVNGRKAAMIYQPEKQKAYLLLPSLDGYIPIDTSQPDTAITDLNIYKDMEPTGRFGKQIGIPCEYWAVTRNGSTLSACLTERYGSLAIPDLSARGSQGLDWGNVPPGYMSLKLIRTEKDGSKETMMKVTKVSPHKLDPGLFTLPDRYRDLSEMMKGSGGSFQQH